MTQATESQTSKRLEALETRADKTSRHVRCGIEKGHAFGIKHRSIIECYIYEFQCIHCDFSYMKGRACMNKRELRVLKATEANTAK